MESKPYLSIIAFCEGWLTKHGDNALGVGWPRGDAEVRYRVMLDLIRPSSSPVTLLDFGCGASHLYEYILKNGIDRVRYSGLDLSDRFLELSRRKFPHVTYHRVDVLDPAAATMPSFDYVVMNGIFNLNIRGAHTVAQEQAGEGVPEAVRREVRASSAAPRTVAQARWITRGWNGCPLRVQKVHGGGSPTPRPLAGLAERTLRRTTWRSGRGPARRAGRGPAVRHAHSREDQHRHGHSTSPSGGVHVVIGDVTGDGVPDLVTAPGGGPYIRVFDGATGTSLDIPLGNFFAYAPGFREESSGLTALERR